MPREKWTAVVFGEVVTKNKFSHKEVQSPDPWAHPYNDFNGEQRKSQKYTRGWAELR